LLESDSSGTTPSSTPLANMSDTITSAWSTPIQRKAISRSSSGGMRGVYQHCKEKHLHRYLAEFDHRYNYRTALGYNDSDRTLAAIKGIEGKRLTYRQPH
jgi:hypothetical protein